MDHKGAIDWSSLKRLIEYHIQSHTDAVVVAGTTGESVTLTEKEFFALLEQTLTYVDGRIPVIAGCGSNNTAHAKQLAKQLTEYKVAAGLSVTPYYNKPTQEGLYRHFAEIGDYSGLPQILYNVPGRTGCDLKPDTVGRLANQFGILGIKEATGDLSRVEPLQRLCSDKFALYSGDDATACEFMMAGGHGVISVTANIAAAEMSQLCRYALNGEYDAAKQLDQRLHYLHRDLFVESNPIPVKWAAERKGLIKSAELRLPLTTLSASAQKTVESALIKAELI